MCVDRTRCPIKALLLAWSEFRMAGLQALLIRSERVRIRARLQSCRNHARDKAALAAENNSFQVDFLRAGNSRSCLERQEGPSEDQFTSGALFRWEEKVRSCGCKPKADDCRESDQPDVHQAIHRLIANFSQTMQNSHLSPHEGQLTPTTLREIAEYRGSSPKDCPLSCRTYYSRSRVPEQEIFLFLRQPIL